MATMSSGLVIELRSSAPAAPAQPQQLVPVEPVQGHAAGPDDGLHQVLLGHRGGISDVELSGQPGQVSLGEAANLAARAERDVVPVSGRTLPGPPGRSLGSPLRRPLRRPLRGAPR